MTDYRRLAPAYAMSPGSKDIFFSVIDPTDGKEYGIKYHIEGGQIPEHQRLQAAEALRRTLSEIWFALHKKEIAKLRCARNALEDLVKERRHDHGIFQRFVEYQGECAKVDDDA
jgi:hypothetical protein